MVRIKTMFEIDGRVVGTSWIRRGRGFYDEAFYIARRTGKFYKADVTIYADGHPLVPALTARERVGYCGYDSYPVMGVVKTS